MRFSSTIQVQSVYPGVFGGAIFRGALLDKRKSIICKVSYKLIDRVPRVGEFWFVEGNEVNHPQHGNQLDISDCHLSDLPEVSYVASILLKHPAFRGFALGRQKIQKLIREVGSYALVDLLNSGNAVAISDVIHPSISEKLVTSWLSLKNEIGVINFLRENQFDAAIARKIMRLCKSNTINRLKNNPYALICFGALSKNIWKTIETVAKNLNFPKNDARRLVGGVEHILYERLRQGHTAMPMDELLLATKDLLGSNTLANDALVYAISQRVVCTIKYRNKKLIQPIGPALIEHSLESKIKRLISGALQNSLFEKEVQFVHYLIEKYSAEFARNNGFGLSEEQSRAAELALTRRCAVITGHGGTGKTTVLRAIVDLANVMDRKVYILALSGKAKERASQATGRDAYTIHGYLKLVREGDKRVDIYCDPLIIVDEASMVDIALFNKLLSVFNGLPYSLTTVGDTSQLPPVGFGIAWHKMACSAQFPSIHLTQVHRQGSNSPILAAARDIRAGMLHQLSEWRGEQKGIYFVESSQENLFSKLCDLKNKVPEAQILTPHMSTRMPDSGHKINGYLQRNLGDDSASRLKCGATMFRAGDPVIVTENSYELDLYNGMSGTLISVEMETTGQQAGYFEFEGRTDQVKLTIDEMLDVGLSLAYGITVHKSQGSEYRSVIFVCAVKSTFLERSLLYTAVTRAKKLLIIIGEKEHYDAAIRRRPKSETLCTGISF